VTVRPACRAPLYKAPNAECGMQNTECKMQNEDVDAVGASLVFNLHFAFSILH
jgi:hypothetical protein